MNRRIATAFIDCILLVLMVFVLLPHKPAISEEEESRVGDLVVEISWCDRCQTDVDLWVKSPGDSPVGYTRTRGRHVSLFRDDLGRGTQAGRGEIAASRVLVDGEWIVNLHAYKDAGNNLPMQVSVNIWYRPTAGNVRGRLNIYHGEVELSRVGQEITVVRWTMQDGHKLPGSVHYSPVQLRAAVASTGGGL